MIDGEDDGLAPLHTRYNVARRNPATNPRCFEGRTGRVGRRLIKGRVADKCVVRHWLEDEMRPVRRQERNNSSDLTFAGASPPRRIALHPARIGGGAAAAAVTRSGGEAAPGPVRGGP